MNTREDVQLIVEQPTESQAVELLPTLLDQIADGSTAIVFLGLVLLFWWGKDIRKFLTTLTATLEKLSEQSVATTDYIKKQELYQKVVVEGIDDIQDTLERLE